MMTDILHLVKHHDDAIHYDSFVVRVMAADVLDMDSAGDLRVFLRTLIGGGVTKIAVDMTGLDFIDSSGIGVLIEAAKHLRQRGGDVALLAVPERVRVIVQPVRLNRFIKMFDTVDEVKNFFRHI
ncbi:MAG TPA: STAS domain-containing protein [Spirochaetota bacterium]|nr:STAS domain-containing protein [Spirochaetota bacterium]HPC40642.1 STAS domain-containing protein [Spirochaetota bacterium]HPL18249.1 STAS domain-containing protein [Spirochaetota bacterium]HQF10247.1 STAS domain-containing protein [Spirochaetota bacterium]HQH99125.1 STAS domain-containing protein [Spirochaetota bacterium]